MMIETHPTVPRCGYCCGIMSIGQSEDHRLPFLCGPSVRVGMLCEACGFVEAPFFSHHIAQG